MYYAFFQTDAIILWILQRSMDSGVIYSVARGFFTAKRCILTI